MVRLASGVLFNIVKIVPFFFQLSAPLPAAEFSSTLKPFLEVHCYDCHGDGLSKGGLDFDKLPSDLSDPATFAKWEHVFDRVEQGEMPPKKVTARPDERELVEFKKALSPSLTKAHAARKGTVLRRLNRIEYQNTLNDLFGTELSLTDLLPQDGRAGEFDTVGEALGVSVEQMRRYLQASGQIIDASKASTVEQPDTQLITSRYDDDKGSKQFIGKIWGKLDDGAVVLYRQIGYPTGMLRSSGIGDAGGRYRIKITGYAHQSDEPVTLSIGGVSYSRGSTPLTFAYRQLPPGKSTTITLEAVLPDNYMIRLEPWGLPFDFKYWNKGRAVDYSGPGIAIQKVELEGPLQNPWPSLGHHLLFDSLTRTEIQPGNPKDKTRPWYKPKFQIENDPGEIFPTLRRIATTAFRRPVEDLDLEPYHQLFTQQLSETDSFEDALRTTTIALFSSPDFLYLREKKGSLDEHALASRLSYFLARSTPDKELLTLAKNHDLKNVLPAQLERLIKDERFDRFITDFTDSWLDLRDIEATTPDKALFPEFDSFLKDSMVDETRAYFRHLIEANLPVSHLVKSDFAFLNNRLAEHYDLPPVEGPAIRKVALPDDSPRGGILTQGSILKVSANGTNTSPVVRGVWVMERILGQTPTPPPPGIAGVEPDIRGTTTLRELLAKHRDSTSCNSCHSKIDPPGFALESFNPVGGFRKRFRSLGQGERIKLEIKGRNVRYRLGLEVDATGKLADGRTFRDIHQFREILALNEDLLAKALVTKILTFATGREMGFSDRPEIKKIVAASRPKHYRVRDLIHLCVQSPIFLRK